MSLYRTLSTTCRGLVPRCRGSNTVTGKALHSLQTSRQASYGANKNILSINRNQRRFQSATASQINDQFLKVPSSDQAVAVNKQGVLMVGNVEFPSIWLRDNCRCHECVHEETQQRMIDTFQIPTNIHIKNSEKLQGRTRIEWSDGHESVYSDSLLQAAAAPLGQRAVIRQGVTEPILWGAEIKNGPPTVRYENSLEGHEDFASLKETEKRIIYKVLANIRKYGFTFISNVPISPSATESLISLIGPIRNTHYGGFYDFTADLASKDTAYTNIALEAHTDTTYFSDPAGLQAFHLLSHTEGSGGASLLVDGFKCADDLKKSDPEAYNVLSEVGVHAHASGNEGVSIMPSHSYPVLSHDTVTGHLTQVRWNTADRAGLDIPVSETSSWYAAARKFDALLKKKENEFWEQLKPGTVVIFDNWRVLHGRSEFTGKRRICGAYVSRDDWVSRFKMGAFGEGVVRGMLPAS